MLLLFAVTLLLNAQTVDEIKTKAAAGDIEAQVRLAAMLADGDGVSQDCTEALKWARLAAQKGDSKAQVLLGGMFYRGLGTTKDVKEAAMWLLRSRVRINSHS